MRKLARASALILVVASSALLCAQNPTAWGLFDWNMDATYLGAFRVPAGTIAGTGFDYNGFGLAYNPANNSLFITGRDHDARNPIGGTPSGQRIAEISIPQ